MERLSACPHHIGSPYGVRKIPGVREAIEQKRWQEADEQIQRVSALLTKEADLLDEATSALRN
jgi:N-acetylated-alpha-linked acidic dipeptidase